MMLKLSSRTIRDIKKFFIKNSIHFLFFVKLWYGLTMRLTKVNTNRVRNFETLDEIPHSFGWGSRYKKDPLNGKLDYLTHPSRLARNVELGEPFGDCDDHAIYWCVALLKSGLASRAWLCIYQMEKEDGSFSGHAICTFKSTKDNMYYWSDYPLPTYLDEYRDKWAYRSAQTYGATPLCAGMIEVTAVKEDDTPVFGEITVLKL
jgi:hypothetical protein